MIGALAAVGIRRARASDTGQQVEVEPVDRVVGRLTDWAKVKYDMSLRCVVDQVR